MKMRAMKVTIMKVVLRAIVAVVGEVVGSGSDGGGASSSASICLLLHPHLQRNEAVWQVQKYKFT